MSEPLMAPSCATLKRPFFFGLAFFVVVTGAAAAFVVFYFQRASSPSPLSSPCPISSPVAYTNSPLIVTSNPSGTANLWTSGPPFVYETRMGHTDDINILSIITMQHSLDQLATTSPLRYGALLLALSTKSALFVDMRHQCKSLPTLPMEVIWRLGALIMCSKFGMLLVLWSLYLNLL
jgi:hypothetical protein